LDWQYRKELRIGKRTGLFSGLFSKKTGRESCFIRIDKLSKTLSPSVSYLLMNDYATIDESEFPLIRIRFTGEKSTDENFQLYLAQTRNCYRHKKKLAIIFDAREAGIPALSHQRMQADWLRENRGLMQDYCQGTAYVIPNKVIRAVLRVIFSLQKQPVPYKIFEKEAEAEKWVRGLDL
jgi:hypothetical protein